MRARLVRLIFATHRWLGVALGLLMLVWCLSGIVMIWAPYPSASLGGRDYRVEGLAPIKPPEQLVLPEIPKHALLTAARLEMLAERPVISLAWKGEAEGGGLFDLATGQRVAKIAPKEALAVAGVYAQRHGINAKPSVKRLSLRDEFTIAGSFNSGRPYYEVRLNDAEGTMLYVSSKTGDVRQRTTSALRFWSWLGAIPHWLYFVELRKDAQLWGQVIIWTSLPGCFLTGLGLFVGIRQFRRRHSTGRLASPYRGPKFVHHMLGLVFGVLVLTWTFSGFTSMQPWGWLESGPAARAALERLAGEPPTWDEMRPALEAQAQALRTDKRDVLVASFSPLRAGSGFLWRMAEGPNERVGPAGAPAPFDSAAQKRAGEFLAGEGNSAKIDLLTTGDAYYYPSAAVGFPVVRVSVAGLEDTRFYLDAVSGDMRFVADPGAREYRWWHMALHRLDIFGSPAREIIVLLLMLGVTAVCGLGAWLGVKKLARGGRPDFLPPDPREGEVP